MNEPRDDELLDSIPTASVTHDALKQTVIVDPDSLPADSLEAGLAAGFGKASAPRSSLGDKRPVLLKEAEGESGLVLKPKSDAVPRREETGDRYRLDGEIARGGMGAVLRGRDVDLGRDLAVKVLLEKYANRPDVAQRFIEEAQIGGQLQHPGIVPIYDIGRFGDLPFFTMKLIKGQTLAAILAERIDPSADHPRLLNIMLQVSQAMAYVHAKGVIHRDLKPANIMLGAFGEVQVMDWGLAKVLAEGGIHDEERASRSQQIPDDVTTIRTARSTGSLGLGTDTEAGSILGTPAYMPPEQAGGDVANLDRRADVFGLGAILCEILTGKPPYVGRSGEEVRRMAANAVQADVLARLDACDADVELTALAKKCVSPESIDRPKDAQAVAAALTTYLDGVQDRLQTAKRERAVALVREGEERKRRKVQLGLAAALMCLLLGGGVFGWWRNEQIQVVHQREARNAEAVNGLLGQCEEALRSNDAAKAAIALDAAKKRLGEGGAENEADRMKRLEADLALTRDLDAIDQFRWTRGGKQFPEPAVVANRIRFALNRFGIDTDAALVDEAEAKLSASIVRTRIVSALDRLLGQPNTTGVRDLLRRVDANTYRDSVRDAYLANDSAKITELAGQSSTLEQPPAFIALLCENATISVERRRHLSQLAAIRRPNDLGLLMSLGSICSANKEFGGESIRWYQAAVTIAPENPVVLTNLGAALAIHKGDIDGSIACFQRSIELAPESALAHQNLGVSLGANRDWDGAVTCLKKAIDLDPGYYLTYHELARNLYQQGNRDESIKYQEKTIELNPNFAEAYLNLSVTLLEKGRTDDAIACLRKCIELNPNDINAHIGLGAILCDVKHDYDGAITAFQRSIELDQSNALGYANLGIALARQGQTDAAIASYKKSIELNPNNPESYNGLAIAMQKNGQTDEAFDCLFKAIELAPWNVAVQKNMGDLWLVKGHLEGAIAHYKNALAFDPNNADARISLAETERLAKAARDKISAFQDGSYTPVDNEERISLAQWCQFKQLNHTSTRLFAAAFAADPKLVENSNSRHRNIAASVASLAAAGQGEDAAELDDTERTRLRKQALDWLRADLALRTQQLQGTNPADRAAAQQAVRHWQDFDFAAIRDAAALAKLPPDEQKAFTDLWSNVTALLKKAEEKPE